MSKARAGHGLGAAEAPEYNHNRGPPAGSPSPPLSSAGGGFSPLWTLSIANFIRRGSGVPPRHGSWKQGRGARRPQVAPSNLRGALSLLGPQGETIVNLLATTSRAPSANKLDTRWRFYALHNTRWRFWAWFLVRTPGSQALDPERRRDLELEIYDLTKS